MAEQDPNQTPAGDPSPQEAATPNPAAPGGATGGGATPPLAADSIAEAALRAAQEAVTSLANGTVDPAAAAVGSGVAFTDDGEAVPGADAPPVQQFPLPSFNRRAGGARVPKGIDLLSDVNLHVKIELGRTRMLIEDVLKLGEGAVVELDKLAGDPVDVYVNDRHIAKGVRCSFSTTTSASASTRSSRVDPETDGAVKAG
jgi:flagellar motor switch protein FliN/FliY